MFSNEDGKLIWCINSSAKYESNWIALHRVLWMNSINGTDFCALIRDLEGKKPTKSESVFRYAIENCVLLGDFSIHFRERSNDVLFGSENQKLLLKWSKFKFCPICLENCFHSPIFCFPSVNVCPLHHCQLVSQCVHCEREIGSNYLDPTQFSAPLACNHCKTPFTRNNLAIKTVDGFKTGCLTLEKIEDWLRKIRNWHFINFDFSIGEPGLPFDLEKASVLSCLRRLEPLPVSSDESCLGVARLIEIRDCANLSSKKFRERNNLRLAIPLNNEIHDASAIAKSIGRYLHNQIRNFCNHGDSRHTGWKNAERPFTRVEPVLVIEAGDCPCCAVMDQWRAYAGKVLALKKALSSKQCPMYDNEAGIYRNNFSLEPNLFAQALISSFAWFVMEHVWFLGSSNPKFSYQYYYLDVYRFEICVRGFTFISNADEKCFRYSLSSSIQELKKCHENIQAAGINSYSNFRWLLRGRKDQWYINMSQYFLTRQYYYWWKYPVQNS